ncbi:LysR family transcriptional regulator [Verticiella sediminum]|uniref:LysR family transcriptional regulator n=1 Tax=Verticiella sediminum TaxID=1247510 RepID=A0A556AUL7_9BURK|nr:LysR family transcriptional regulator [Verticiella sediminum]TSH96631.1 LysR family transcriptional regulator [Verticiella sediminum]
MRQDHLDGLIAFTTVAEVNGFTAAAVKLGVSTSAISQAVRNLEERLGLVLFNRTTRSVSLTEIGERYLERVLPALEQLTAASEELGREAGHPAGQLRINVPRAGHLIVLQPILRRFMDAYPDINVEVRVENLLVDIVSQGYDAGIRFGKLVEKDMVAVRVGPPMSTHIIASPEYLERRGVPRHPRDLLEHDCINYRHITTGLMERWEFARGDEKLDLAVSGRLTVNDSEILVRSALDGLGIANMINGYIEPFLESGRLVRLLSEWSPEIPSLHLYYPDRRRVPAKLRALIDFLRAERDAPVRMDDLLL